MIYEVHNTNPIFINLNESKMSNLLIISNGEYLLEITCVQLFYDNIWTNFSGISMFYFFYLYCFDKKIYQIVIQISLFFIKY